MTKLAYTGEISPPENVLASRYASPQMVGNFSEQARVFTERGIWIAVMEAQADLGLDIPADVIEDYQAVQADINLDSMREREKASGHDVNARIKEFNALAGHERIHMGMTSRDLTENVEQYQIARGMDIVISRVASTLGRFAVGALEWSELPMAGRTHNVPAQIIILAKRFSNFGEELRGGYDRLAALRDAYKLRGIKGPVGTQQDMLDLFEGDAGKVAELERRVAEALGFSNTLNSVGQIYPRSMDFDVVTALKQATAGPTNFATTLRLMAGQDLATEGFMPGQVGSSAMPHKMNATKSERIAGLSAVLTGHVAMAAEISSRQWNEGDVSCSAARRVFIPDAFFATDGIFQTAMTVLDRFGAYPAVINQELERYLPFLATTKVLMAAVKAGVGRETAHQAIKEHAVAVALNMREHGGGNDLLDRLAADERLPIDKVTLGNAMTQPLSLTGLAAPQVARFVDATQSLLERHPEAVSYTPATVL